MRTLSATLVLVASIGGAPVSAQPVDLSHIRERFAVVEASLEEWTRSEKAWTHPAGDGLLVSWTEADGTIRKLELEHDVDGVSLRLAYWFDHALPFFALETEERFARFPDEDASGLGRREDRFYVVEGELIEWLADRPGRDRFRPSAEERRARGALLLRTVGVLRDFLTSPATDLWDFDADGVVFQRDASSRPEPSRSRSR